MKIRPAIVAVSCAAALSACATRPPVPDTVAEAFVLEEDLLGATTGVGQFTTITGADRGFTAALNGTWDGTTLTLVEDFVFDDGETDRKTWRLTKVADGEYVGTREDVVGEARGFVDGDAFRLEYLVDLPLDDGGSRRVRFKDVLVTQADGSVLNKANVSWRGVRVGRVELVITRDE